MIAEPPIRCAVGWFVEEFPLRPARRPRRRRCLDRAYNPTCLIPTIRLATYAVSARSWRRLLTVPACWSIASSLYELRTDQRGRSPPRLTGTMSRCSAQSRIVRCRRCHEVACSVRAVRHSRRANLNTAVAMLRGPSTYRLDGLAAAWHPRARRRHIASVADVFASISDEPPRRRSANPSV